MYSEAQKGADLRAIVTGAASGIGLAVAQRLNSDSLAREGYAAALTLVDIAESQLKGVRDALVDAGAKVEAVVADMGDSTTAEQVVSRSISRFGGLDALVSNAGILKPASLLELSIVDWDKTFNVNTRATWLLARAAFPHLKASRGAIVAIASLAAHNPMPSQGAYAPSKAALLMLVRQLACDWGPDGIRANTVSPGSTLTGVAGSSPDWRLTQPGATPGRNPLGFIAAPEDQAAAVAFLLGPDARFITGTDLQVDGGAQTQLMEKSGHPRQASRISAA